ncbi:hypothetical protein [Streptomyces sp. S.PB5]|uniref:hypothetical protein n=1 Tax=Streptomyces sp. S.PB5 TaxID=3020844 RepID=UPI0025B1508C|nr:hypothetical protein [Streptomyces sp. S.PB5]MDN3024796.1 hypothetical protein [Streptomyces sp. S.PB5]
MGQGGKSDLSLPLSELEDYGRRLRSIKTRLNHTKKLFDQYKDDIGDGSVNDALDDFESNWEDGREDITQQLDALASMSDAVVREFKKLDDELAKQINEKMTTEDKRPKK